MGSESNIATAAEAHINEVSGPRDGTHTHTNEQTNYADRHMGRTQENANQSATFRTHATVTS